MEDPSPQPVAGSAAHSPGRRRKRVSVFLVCLLVATALWLLRAFENEYTTTISQPVQYTGLPEDYHPVGTLPKELRMEVKGLGLSILKHNWSFSRTVVTVDLGVLQTAPAIRKKGFTGKLPMNRFINDFSTQLKNLKVNAVYPDTLICRFAVEKRKSVPVTPVFSNSKGVAFHTDTLAKISPVEVELTGPDLILDTMRSIRTKPLTIKGIPSDFPQTAELEDPGYEITVKPATVTATLKK